MLEEVNTLKDDEFVDEPLSDSENQSTYEQASTSHYGAEIDLERLRTLEDEQEKLNSSLLALTSHFAQVQFRLKQICAATGNEKEALLKQLEEFTFKGCPDISEIKEMRRRSLRLSESSRVSTDEHDANLEKQKRKQLELITQLREQLEDLEKYAYEAGESAFQPTSQVLQKQQAIIDHLKNKIQFEADLDALSSEELQTRIDQAVKRLVNPIKIKDKLVQQLQTQVNDLEMFVEFLQDGGAVAGNFVKCVCNASSSTDKKACPVHNSKSMISAKRIGYEKPRPADISSNTATMVKHTLSLVQMFMLSQLGCRSRRFYRNEMKNSGKGSHYGDYRANLELAIQYVLEIAPKVCGVLTTIKANKFDDEEDEFNDDVFDHCPEELVAAVRKQLCPALRDLLQHGMINSRVAVRSLAIVSCLGPRTKSVQADDPGVHAWTIIEKYYEMKHGKEFSDDPLRRLSQSFNLNDIGGKSITSKQLLLSTIDNVLTTHARLKRSQDAMFKAFVSAALNRRKLTAWLRMILRTREIVEESYASWSYVAKTGFDDACSSLEKLNAFTFQLPIDLAVRPFQNIKDIF